jgi:AcrR family transcriptional regulator
MAIPLNAAAPRGRARQARVAVNAGRLIDAGVEVMAEGGWSAMSFLAVSNRAGMSRRPLQARFASPSELMAALWNEGAGAAIEELLSDALNHAGLLDREPNADALGADFELANNPTVPLKAAIELVLVAQFDPVVGRAATQTLGAQIDEWCTPETGTLSRTKAAQRAFLMCYLFGLLLDSHRPSARTVNMAVEGPRMIETFAMASKPARLPVVNFDHLDHEVPFETGDVTTDLLMRSTLNLIGLHGYDAVSTEAIAAGAGVSQGALFARFGSKIELFLEAWRLQNALALRANAEAMAKLQATSTIGIAEAVAMRNFQRPDRDALRAVTLEGMRVGWHYPEVIAATDAELTRFRDELIAAGSQLSLEQFHSAWALGSGLLVLPIVSDAGAKLPYDVVSVPIEATLPPVRSR